MKQKVSEFQQQVNGKNALEILQWAEKTFDGKIAFATSLGEEDQVLTDMIAKHAPGISVFTLDTGRLFPETYALIAQTQERYSHLDFQVYFPDPYVVETMVNDKGINLFYKSVENRKQCCHVRKVEPLQRALNGKKAWVVGNRRAQSVTRASMQPVEWDDGNGLIRIAPLAFWSLDEVHQYIKDYKVDINPLHDKGFLSIGCQPCTRAIKPGEDIRAGRWWWEQPEQKECGLHNNPNKPKPNNYSI